MFVCSRATVSLTIIICKQKWNLYLWRLGLFSNIIILVLLSVEGVCGVCVVDGWFTASPGLSQTDWTGLGGAAHLGCMSNHGTQDKPVINTHTQEEPMAMGGSCHIALVEGGGPTEGCSRPSEELPPRPSCRASLRAHPASPCNQLAQGHLCQLRQQPQASGLQDGGKPGSTIWATWAFAQGPLSREGPFAIGYIYIYIYILYLFIYFSLWPWMSVVGPGCIAITHRGFSPASIWCWGYVESVCC